MAAEAVYEPLNCSEGATRSHPLMPPGLVPPAQGEERQAAGGGRSHAAFEFVVTKPSVQEEENHGGEELMMADILLDGGRKTSHPREVHAPGRKKPRTGRQVATTVVLIPEAPPVTNHGFMATAVFRPPHSSQKDSGEPRPASERQRHRHDDVDLLNVGPNSTENPIEVDVPQRNTAADVSRSVRLPKSSFTLKFLDPAVEKAYVRYRYGGTSRVTRPIALLIAAVIFGIYWSTSNIMDMPYAKPAMMSSIAILVLLALFDLSATVWLVRLLEPQDNRDEDSKRCDRVEQKFEEHCREAPASMDGTESAELQLSDDNSIMASDIEPPSNDEAQYQRALMHERLWLVTLFTIQLLFAVNAWAIQVVMCRPYAGWSPRKGFPTREASSTPLNATTIGTPEEDPCNGCMTPMPYIMLWVFGCPRWVPVAAIIPITEIVLYVVRSVGHRRPLTSMFFDFDGVRLGLLVCVLLAMRRMERNSRRRFEQQTSRAAEIDDAEKSHTLVSRLLSGILPRDVVRRLAEQTLTSDVTPAELEARPVSDDSTSRFERMLRPIPSIVDSRQASLIWCDLACFDAWSSERTVKDVFEALNNTFLRIDYQLTLPGFAAQVKCSVPGISNNMAAALDSCQSVIEKICTVGDAYVACCGLIVADPMHPLKAAYFARAVLDGSAFGIRAGVHTGTVHGGIVRSNSTAYQICGKAVDAVRAVHSVAPPGRALLSKETVVAQGMMTSQDGSEAEEQERFVAEAYAEMFNVKPYGRSHFLLLRIYGGDPDSFDTESDTEESTSDEGGKRKPSSGLNMPPPPPSSCLSPPPPNGLQILNLQPLTPVSPVATAFDASTFVMRSEASLPPPVIPHLDESAREELLAHVVYSKQHNYAVDPTVSARRLVTEDSTGAEDVTAHRYLPSYERLKQRVFAQPFRLSQNFRDPAVEQRYRKFGQFEFFLASPSSSLGLTTFFLTAVVIELSESNLSFSNIGICSLLFLMNLFATGTTWIWKRQSGLHAATARLVDCSGQHPLHMFLTRWPAGVAISRAAFIYYAFVMLVFQVMWIDVKRMEPSVINTDVSNYPLLLIVMFQFIGSPPLHIGIVTALQSFSTGLPVVLVFGLIYGSGHDLFVPILLSYGVLIPVFNFVCCREREKVVREAFVCQEMRIIASAEFNQENDHMMLLLSKFVPPVVLPTVVDSLTAGFSGVIACRHPCAGVLVCGIGSRPTAAMTGSLDRPNLVLCRTLLERIQNAAELYDRVVEEHSGFDIIKVRTVGDVLLLVSGIGYAFQSGVVPPVSIATTSSDSSEGPDTHHLQRLATVACKLVNEIEMVLDLPTCVGIHCGPVLAGVVGHDTVRFDVFGPTVAGATKIMATMLPECCGESAMAGMLPSRVWSSCGFASVIESTWPGSNDYSADCQGITFGPVRSAAKPHSCIRPVFCVRHDDSERPVDPPSH